MPYLVGTKEVANELRAIRKVVDAELDRGLREEADETLILSNYYCPIKSGALRSSGHVVPRGMGQYDIVYDIWYAGYVHEILRYHHAPPTQAKFLERAAMERHRDIERNLHARIESATSLRNVVGR